MDVEHFFNAAFAGRDWLDDTDMASRLRDEQVDDDEQLRLLEAWKTRGWIHIVEYNQAGGTLRRIYFIEYSTPRIV